MGYIRKPKPTVRIYRSDDYSLWRWLGPMLAALVLLLGVAGYLLLSGHGGSSLSAAQADELRATIATLRQKNQELREQLARAVRSSEIDSKASEELMTTLARREKELLDLKEELDFYKSMVATGGKAGGALSIRSFALKATDGKGKFHYKLVLARVDGKGKPIKGRVQLRLQGRKEDKSVTLEWRDISSGGKKMPRFRFQFFQTLEGELMIPEGFKPEHILVKVIPEGKKQRSVQQSFSWNSVIEGKEKDAGKEKTEKVGKN